MTCVEVISFLSVAIWARLTLRGATILFILITISTSIYSQLWQQLADSAKIFSDQKNTGKAIKYYKMQKKNWREILPRRLAMPLYEMISGYLNFKIGQFDETESFYLEAKQVRQKVLGEKRII